MKLSYYPLNFTMALNSYSLNIIALEVPSVLHSFIEDLYHQLIMKEEQFFDMVDDNESHIPLEKEVEMITSPLDLDYSKNRNLQKQLYREIVSDIEMDDLLVQQFSEANALIVSIVDEMCMYSEYELEFNDELNYDKILKALDVQLMNPTGKFIERLSDYLRTVHRLLGKSIFLLFNIDMFLDVGDDILLDEFARSEEITVISFLAHGDTVDSAFLNLILDEDFCEI